MGEEEKEEKKSLRDGMESNYLVGKHDGTLYVSKIHTACRAVRIKWVCVVAFPCICPITLFPLEKLCRFFSSLFLFLIYLVN